MELNKPRKPHEAFDDLERAIKAYKPSSKRERSLSFLALSKAFEVALEYAWKELKRQVEDKGLEAFSPKDAVREAAQLGVLTEPEVWIRAINLRNLSVHDYFSVPESDFVFEVKHFLELAREILPSR